jgi:hypothetical protein
MLNSLKNSLLVLLLTGSPAMAAQAGIGILSGAMHNHSSPVQGGALSALSLAGNFLDLGASTGNIIMGTNYAGTAFIWYPARSSFFAGTNTAGVKPRNTWRTINLGSENTCSSYSECIGNYLVSYASASMMFGNGAANFSSVNNSTNSISFFTGASLPVVKITTSGLDAVGLTINGLPITGSVVPGSSQTWTGENIFDNVANEFLGTFYGDGANLVNLPADVSKVSKSGDTMTGPLELTTATLTGNKFSVGGSTFVISNGYVGIGLNNPTRNLHISAPLPGMQFNSTSWGSALAVSIAAAGAGIIIPPALGFGVMNSDGGAFNLFIKNDSNVGLLQGNTPQYRLDVNGGARFTSSVTASAYYGDGSHLTGIAGGIVEPLTLVSSLTVKNVLGISATTYPQVVIDDTYPAGAGGIINLGGLAGAAAVIAQNTYLDTGSFNWFLSKAGGASVIMTNTENSGNGGNFSITAATAGPAGENVSTRLKNVLTYDALNQRVGILNSSPAAALDVSGNVKATGFEGSGQQITDVGHLNGSQNWTNNNLFTKTDGTTTISGWLYLGTDTNNAGCSGCTSQTVDCDAGMMVITGGCAADTGSNTLTANYPADNNTWSCSSSGASNITAYVVCSRLY